MDTTDKVRENRLRRMADRQGMSLQKSRRRDPRALDYGTYYLIDKATEVNVSFGGGPLTLDEVEHQLS